MSGQPLINSTDASKFRQNYLSNLALQADINDKNLQANKIFKKTGQTPTQVLDTRLTAEKLADTERLKIDVRGQLSQIADGQQAEAIVQGLTPDGLRYLAQHIDEIIKDIKPKYKLGVLASVFIPYLNKSMVRAQQTNEVSLGLQQDAGRQILLGIDQILNGMVDRSMLDDLRDTIGEANFAISQQLRRALQRDIDELKQIIPTKDDLREIAQIQDGITKSTIQRELNEALRELPTNQQINAVLRDIAVAINHRDAQRTERLALILHQLLSVAPITTEQIRDIHRHIAQARSEFQYEAEQTRNLIMLSDKQILATIEREIAELKSLTGRLNTTSRGILTQDLFAMIRASQIQTTDQLREAIKAEAIQIAKTQPSNGPAEEATVEVQQALPDNLDAIRIRDTDYKPLSSLSTIAKKRDYFNKMYDVVQISGETASEFLEKATGKKYLGHMNSDQLDKAVIELNNRLRLKGWGQENPTGVGKGLKNGRIRGGSIVKQTDYSKGIMPVKQYVPIGKYHINSHRLNDNIIALRRPTGCNVMGFPVERVSNDLGNVLRTIVGGGQPQFHQLEKLTDEEKMYLHKLSKATNILDKVSIPTPNKDDDDKDINQFEIMKGELMSGNDSVDLVKKFKILIMKMVKKDLLPKSQAKDILMDLVSLGY
jgi:hypothetical protein